MKTKTLATKGKYQRIIAPPPRCTIRLDIEEDPPLVKVVQKQPFQCRGGCSSDEWFRRAE